MNFNFWYIYSGEFIKDWYFEIKYFIQRGRRGYSDRDAWSLHDYMSEIMLDVLPKYEQELYDDKVCKSIHDTIVALKKIKTIETNTAFGSDEKEWVKMYKEYKKTQNQVIKGFKYFYNWWN